MKKGLLLLSLVMMCLPLMAEQRTAPALMADGTVPTNYIVYLTRSPQAYTAINNVVNDAVNVSVNGRTINVAGASSVAIYNTAGALVSRDAATMLPAGVYVVIADGKSYKVVLK